ncbi:YcnI family protein [Glaciihabitans sp. dw_435]|uniref:YcnI family copper-binding membrane protein n=1 Tax=Glaciihabitans sp. dw_435 TaxID=2720081 RepID=UPI002102A7AD|nr:YcnI family protein [Glaciihabitans sp. dw_435]
MTTRWMRVLRGTLASVVATFVAAFSHVLAGGAMPNLWAISLSFALSTLACIALAGRGLSLWRTIASVGFSQVLFHGLFSSMGAASTGTSASMTMTMSGHAGHADSVLTVTGDALGSATIHTPAMWAAHAIAAVITVVALRHGERAFWTLRSTASLYFSRLLRAAHAAHIARDDSPARIGCTGSVLPRDLRVLFSALHHRGPPSLVVAYIRRPPRACPSRAGALAPPHPRHIRSTGGSMPTRHAPPSPSVVTTTRTPRTTMKKSTITKSATAVIAGAFLAIAVPLAASAHVSISPNTAAADSYSVITFKVPNESATTTTTKLEVTLPTDHPFLSVSYVPVPGWTTQLVTTKLDTPVKADDDEITEATTKVIWTAAAGSEITAGQLQQFSLSLGPVPDTGSVTFTADQTYSDGKVVSWSETGDDAENPAPVLYINDEAPAGQHGAATATHTEADASTASASSDDLVARVLSIIALVLGAVGLVLGITARRKNAA